MSYEAFERWRCERVVSPTLSIVIPAYNEGERILPTLGAFAVIVSKIAPDWELIVSDDGSRDLTSDLVETLGWVNLRVLRHANTGKGGAVQRGVLAATGQMILFADADNSTPIEELSRLIAALEAGNDVAIGSRAAIGATEENKSIVRKLGSAFLRSLARAFTGLKTRDTQCGFKLFQREAALRLFTAQRAMGFSFDLEILYLARKFGYRVIEVPVRWFDAPGSKVDAVRDGLRFIRDLCKLILNDLGGHYRKTGGLNAPGHHQRLPAESADAH